VRRSLVYRLLLSLCAALLSSTDAIAQAGPATSIPVVISHVTVIDATGAPPKPEMSIEILRHRIVAIERSDSFTVPSDARVIDATGKFVIPGLWDMHVHTGAKEIFFPLYIANGVTGVRDMGGDVEDSTEAISTRYVDLCIWRKAIARGDLVGPRMTIAGFLIDGYPWQGDVSVSNPSEARAAVDALHDMGVDFIKVKSFVPRDAYLAIADESRAENITFAGHVPDTVSAAEASASGQKSIEHLTGVALGSSAEELSLSKELASAFAARDRAGYGAVQIRALETLDDGKAAELFRLFINNGTWQVPTLVELRTSSTIPSRSTSSDPRWAYIPNRLRVAWMKTVQEDMASRTPRPDLPATISLVHRMHAAGVNFMAGTDTPNPSILPGFSLHEELQLLVSAGFTPMEALQAATRNPARYLQRESELGTVEVGKLADMVLLNANPLDDISNTQSIWGVVQDGRYLDRPALDAMLKAAGEAATK
jgi:imidazolonepropionase-like amidohydrolase